MQTNTCDGCLGVEGPLFGPQYAAAVGRELYLLGSNDVGAHWDGARWQLLSQPYTYDWTQFVASPGALWGIAQVEAEDGPMPLPELWRRDRFTGDWETFGLPFRARSMWAADDEHLWLTDGEQIAMFDGTRLSEPFAPGGPIKSLTGTAWNDGWMVAGEMLWHLDGAEWTPWHLQPCGGDRMGFVVAHPESPWVQCSDAMWTRLERWDGDAWKTHLKPVDPTTFVPSAELGEWQSSLRSVWRPDGSGRHRVVAGYYGQVPTRAYGASFWHVSDQGVAAEWDGSKWIERGRTQPVVLASATSGDSLWLAGRNGFVARRRGGVWHRVETNHEGDLTSIAAYGEHLWVAGHGLGRERRPDGRWRDLFAAYWVEPHLWMGRDSPVAWAMTLFVAHRRDLATGRGTNTQPLDGLVQLSGDDETNLWAAVAYTGLLQWDPSSRAWGGRSPKLAPLGVSARGDDVWAVAEEGLLRHGANDEWTPMAWDGPAPAQVLLLQPGDAWVRDAAGAVWRHDGRARRQMRASGCSRLLEGPKGMECLSARGVEPAEEL